MKRFFSNARTILLIVLLIIIWINYYKIISYVPDKVFGLNIEYIFISIFLIFLIYESYKDFRSFEYTSRNFIIITDVIKIITFLILVVLFTKSYDKSNVDLTFERHRLITWVMITLSFVDVVKSFIKNDKYLKNSESDIVEKEYDKY